MTQAQKKAFNELAAYVQSHMTTKDTGELSIWEQFYTLCYRVYPECSVLYNNLFDDGVAPW